MNPFFRSVFLWGGLAVLSIGFVSCKEANYSTGKMDVLSSTTAVTPEETESTTPWKNCQTEEVMRVTSGDTFLSTTGTEFRLLGINAPDITSEEWFGKESIEHVSTLLQGKKVCVEKDERVPDPTDDPVKPRYTYLEDGTFVNGTLVEEGYAHVYRKADFSKKEEFLYFEEAARKQGKGMWSKEGFVKYEVGKEKVLAVPTAGETTEEKTVAETLPPENTTTSFETEEKEGEIPSFDVTQVKEETLLVEGEEGKAETVEISGEEKAPLISLEEARKGKKYLGQRKRISFRVRSAWDRGSLVYLNSERNSTDAGNFSVIIPRKNKGSFTMQGLDSIAHFYLGEHVEVTGLIKFYKGAVVLEVEKFEDITIL